MLFFRPAQLRIVNGMFDLIYLSVDLDDIFSQSFKHKVFSLTDYSTNIPDMT